jgi:hypothetical protein
VRVIGLFLAGVLALMTPLMAHAFPLGSDIEHLGTVRAPGIVKAWGGCGWGWHPVPGHWSRWRGEWVPPHCAPNHYYGSGGPYGSWGGPYGYWGGYNGAQGPYGGWRTYGGGY